MGAQKTRLGFMKKAYIADIALTDLSPLLMFTEFRAAGPIWSPVSGRTLISVTLMFSPIPWSGVRRFDP